MAQKEAAEKRLRAELAKNAAKQKELGDAWDTIEKSIQVARQLDAERNFIVNAAGLNSTLFTQARQMVRAAYNPPAAGQARRPRRARGGGTGRRAWRRRRRSAAARRRAGPQHGAREDQPHRVARLHAEVPGRRPRHRQADPRAARRPRRARPNSSTRRRITDPEIRALLRAGGKATIDVSTDPMIVLARKLEADAQAITKRYEDEVTAVQSAAYPKIGQAVFVVDGAKAYPDATGTLAPVVRRGQELHGGRQEDPAVHLRRRPLRALARSTTTSRRTTWRRAGSAAKAALDPKMPFNFVSTNDIVGGNSGSAVVNKKGELVGLIFDGNIQSLPGYFIYEEADQPRRVGGLAADHRGAAEGLQGRRAGRRDRRNDGEEEVEGKKPEVRSHSEDRR